MDLINLITRPAVQYMSGLINLITRPAVQYMSDPSGCKPCCWFLGLTNTRVHGAT